MTATLSSIHQINTREIATDHSPNVFLRRALSFAERLWRFLLDQLADRFEIFLFARLAPLEHGTFGGYQLDATAFHPPHGCLMVQRMAGTNSVDGQLHTPPARQQIQRRLLNTDVRFDAA